MIRRPHTDRDLSRAELELAAVDLLHRREEWEQHVFHDPSGARTITSSRSTITSRRG